MAKMLSPNTTIWWVPAEQVTNEAELLKVATYTGNKAINISCAIVAGMTLNPTDSETENSRSICDAAAVETPVSENFEADLTFFREEIKSSQQAAGTDSVYDKVYQLFKHGWQEGLVEGYLVRRIGKRHDVPAAADQEVSYFKVMADNPRDEIGEGQSSIQFHVPFRPAGTMKLNKKLTA